MSRRQRQAVAATEFPPRSNLAQVAQFCEQATYLGYIMGGHNNCFGTNNLAEQVTQRGMLV